MNTKDKILNEALRLFAAKGYGAVSVEQIADAVGIKAPSLYKHYKGKRDIFNSIVKRMEEMDAEEAQEADMPEETAEANPESYEDVDLESIRIFSKSMFSHWTEEEFSANFRRMLTLEHFADPEMARLYQQYLGSGPLGYMADVFCALAQDRAEAYNMALEFYGPMHLLYSVYDGAEDKKSVVKSCCSYIDSFIDKLQAAEKIKE